MARPTKVPSYSLHKPSGRAVVKIKCRSIYLGKYGSDESRDAYARIVADLLAGRPIEAPQPAQPDRGNTPRSTLTIGRIAARFQKWADGYYLKNGKPTSEPAAVRCALKFLTANHADLPAADFSIGDLKVIRQAMVDAGHCRNSVNKNVRRIRLAFTWAATEELLPPSVPQALSLLPGLKAGRTTEFRKRFGLEAAQALLGHSKAGSVDCRKLHPTLHHFVLHRAVDRFFQESLHPTRSEQPIVRLLEHGEVRDCLQSDRPSQRRRVGEQGGQFALI